MRYVFNAKLAILDMPLYSGIIEAPTDEKAEAIAKLILLEEMHVPAQAIKKLDVIRL